MEDKELQALYEHYREGDPEAFTALVTALRQPVTAYILRVVQSPHDAEDLAAETFLQLLIHPHRFQGQSSLKAYLFAIARHKAIDYLRRHKPEVAVEEFPEVADKELLPEARLILAEDRRRFREAFAALKTEYRTALYLTAVRELSYEEAAKVMRKTPKQVENYCYRGRKQLRHNAKGENRCDYAHG